MIPAGGKDRALWLLACVCGLVVVLEYMWPGETETVPPTPIQPRAGPDRAGNADPVGAWTAAILARPLFNATRRPDAAAAPTAMAERHEDLPRLAGILVSTGRSQAIFAPADAKDRSIVAAEGTMIGAWKIMAIRAGEVQLSGPGGTRIVRPSYANGAAASRPFGSQPPPPDGNSLLPPAPPDTRPFNSVAEPSGAAILRNMMQSQAARSTQ